MLIRHYDAETSDEVVLERTLAEVRYANVYGRLYPDPTDPARRYALKIMCFAGIVENVPATATCWGGWFVCPCGKLHP